MGFNKKIGKYVLYVNAEHFHPKKIPAIFRGKNWVILESPEIINKKDYFPEWHICSYMIGNNFFMVNS